MAEENIYKGIGHVIRVCTDESGRCEHCDHMINGSSFAESINHYIEAHGYELLHVGHETARDDVGNLWHMTAAVLGK